MRQFKIWPHQDIYLPEADGDTDNNGSTTADAAAAAAAAAAARDAQTAAQLVSLAHDEPTPTPALVCGGEGGCGG